MPAGMTTATQILKEVYVGSINAQLNNEITTYNRIKTKTDSQKYGGKYVEFPIHVQRNSGIGARGENAALPSAGNQVYRQAQITLNSFYGAYELTGQAFDLAEKDYQSFASLASEEANRLGDDLGVDRNRQVFQDGTGTVAIVASVSGQVITLQAAGQYENRVQLGMKLDAMTGNSSTVRQTGLVVTDIDTVNHTITVTGTLTGVVNNDVLTRVGNYGQEWLGLEAIINNTSSLYGIANTNGASGSAQWNAQVNTNGGTPTSLTELMMARMADRIKTAGGKATAIYSTPGVFRAYWSLLQSQRRFVNTQEFKGGYQGLAFTTPGWGDIPFLSDYMANPNTMYFVNEDQLDIYRPYEYKVMDRAGSTWHQKTDSTGAAYDVWQAWLVERSQIGTRRRNTHGKITNIIEDTP